MQHLWLKIHHRCELCIGLPAALYNGPCFAPRELRTLKSARLSKAQHNPQHSAQCIAGQIWTRLDPPQRFDILLAQERKLLDITVQSVTSFQSQ